MNKLIQLLFALLTLGAFIWAGWQGYLLLRQEQMGLPEGTRSAVIIIAILAIICTFMITTAISNHGDKIFRGHQYESRLALYEKCIAVWQAILLEIPEGRQVQIELHFRELDAQMALLASAKVLKAYNELRKSSGTEGVNSKPTTESGQKLLIAMREDLGQAPDFLIRKEIQQMFS